MKQMRKLIACLFVAVLNLSLANYSHAANPLNDDGKPVYSADLEKQAKKDLDAQCQLALCYYNGYGIAQNKDKALKLWEKAAKKGHGDSYYWLGKHYWGIDQWIGLDYYNLGAACGSAKAQNEMGNIYNVGYHLGRRIAEAEEMWRRAAMQGHAEAQYNLARHLSDNQRKNGNEAVEWYRKAAEQGHARAQYELGNCYQNGKGVTPDYNEAINWYRKAMENGYDCQSSLDALLAKVRESRESESAIVKQYREAAERGDAQAQFNLGLAYYNGEGVSKKDQNEAERWFRKSAEQGNAGAQCYLGRCYDSKGSVNDKKPFEEALKWYRKSAEQGYPQAYFLMAEYYSFGIIGFMNEDEGIRLYRKAADLGYAPAQETLGYRYSRGWGVNQDINEAFKWYQKAIDQGSVPAFVALGDLYEKGEYIRQDLNEAISWYRKAEANGSKEATKYIARCQEQIDEQKRQAQMAANNSNSSGGSAEGNVNFEEMGINQLLPYAKSGNANAQYYLGCRLLNNDNDILDLDLKYAAKGWLRKAAAQGHEKAINKLKELGEY